MASDHRAHTSAYTRVNLRGDEDDDKTMSKAPLSYLNSGGRECIISVTRKESSSTMSMTESEMTEKETKRADETAPVEILLRIDGWGHDDQGRGTGETPVADLSPRPWQGSFSEPMYSASACSADKASATVRTS